MEETRRNFIKQVTGSVLAGAAAIVATKESGASEAAAGTSEKTGIDRSSGGTAKADPLLRMEAELKASLKRQERRWIFVIDLRKCTGCQACTVACMAENKLPPGVVYRTVTDVETGRYPDVKRAFTPMMCSHCEKPPCVPVCPVGATTKTKDGVVVIDYDLCIGCRYCILACPYNARVFDFGYDDYLTGFPASQGSIVGQEGLDPYNKKPGFEYNKKSVREKNKQPIGNARKCNFCLHRIQAGILPACTTTCIGRATYFGDKLNPKSLVSELIAKPNVMRMKVETGADPQCYYLV